MMPTIYLIEQLNETDFAEVVYGLIIRQGCVVKREVLDNGCEFIGTDVEGYPIHFRTQINPTKNDFEKYYQIVLKKQKLTPNLRGYFCHLTNYDPDFCVSESERDPNSQFGEIESLGPRQLISFFDATSWLSRWLTQRYCRPKELT